MRHYRTNGTVQLFPVDWEELAPGETSDLVVRNKGEFSQRGWEQP